MTVISKVQIVSHVLSKFGGSSFANFCRMASNDGSPARTAFEKTPEKSSETAKETSETAHKPEEKAGPSYILIDIGANLTNKKFSRDLEAVVRRAKDAGPRGAQARRRPRADFSQPDKGLEEPYDTVNAKLMSAQPPPPPPLPPWGAGVDADLAGGEGGVRIPSPGAEPAAPKSRDLAQPSTGIKPPAEGYQLKQSFVSPSPAPQAPQLPPTDASQSPVKGSPGVQSPVKGSPGVQSPVKGSPGIQSPVSGSALLSQIKESQSPVSGSALLSQIKESQSPVSGSALLSQVKESQSPVKKSPVVQSPAKGLQAPVNGSPVGKSPLKGSPRALSPDKGSQSPVQKLQFPLKAFVDKSPAVQSQVKGSPAVHSPVKGSPATQSLAKGSPAVQSPVKGSPAVQSPVKGSPAVQSPIKGSPAVQSPIKGSPAVQSPVKGSPAVQSPVKGSPTVQSLVKGSAVQPPVKGSPAIQSPVKRSSAVQSPAKGSPGVQSPIKGAPAVQSPVKGSEVQFPDKGSPALQSTMVLTPGKASPAAQSPAKRSSSVQHSPSLTASATDEPTDRHARAPPQPALPLPPGTIEPPSATIVCDNGSGVIKAGLAGESAPRMLLPALVGRPRARAIMLTASTREWYVGEEAQRMRGVLALRYPTRRGVVVDWDSAERLWEAAFAPLGGARDRRLLLTECPLNPRAHRERMLETAFETLGTATCYVAVQAVLCLYAAGATTGLVVDAGDEVTHSVPVYQGYCLPHVVARLNLGGRDLTRYLGRLLTERGWYLASSAEAEIVRDVKERLGFVAADFGEELAREAESEQQYTLPDGQTLELGGERFRAAEPLFTPALIGVEGGGIARDTFDSIMRCDIDLRRAMFANIVLAGGSSSFPGIDERLRRDVAALAPAGVEVRCAPPTQRRELAAWIGGSVLAAMDGFAPLWIQRHEYEEFGPKIVHRKCF